MLTGRCECGEVRFRIDGPARDSVTICHCSQCRRSSGHVWASTHAPFAALRFDAEAGLTWYASSDFAKRGFCRFCGSSLFYRLNDEDGIGIAAGCLDVPTGFRVGKHIFVKDKGDYYEITDDTPQLERF
ncbi:GFA family protein [Gymnodinialimonas sp. 2305UL16-5]|uniref:GFA family protein n=1 Tax=Gymnodinialimonas mytili TaxID=3126503 RepID=UPI00309FF106